MQPYIILQYPYETIEIALCNQGKILEFTSEHKFNAIKLTIPHIVSMLSTHQLTIKDIQCIGVNVGPGPYNTLRALLTMANGIHFAIKTPLIGLSALDLLPSEYPNQNNVVIFSAFLNHVFYAFHGETQEHGACSIEQLISKINTLPFTMLALGNGATLYKDLLVSQTKNIIFTNHIDSFNSIEILAEKTFEKFTSKKIHDAYVKPIYFENLVK